MIFRPVDRHGNVGAVRLTGNSIAVTVKNYMTAIGKDPAAYAGHSLRAGFATAAGRAGAEERDIMRQTKHRSTVIVRRCIRDGSLFRGKAVCSAEMRLGWSACGAGRQRGPLPSRMVGLLLQCAVRAAGSQGRPTPRA